MKKYNAITLGEALIDYIPLNHEVCGEYKAAVGGAPLNVAVGLSRLTNNIGMIARVGADPLGKEIIATLEKKGIDCSFVQIDQKRHTPVTIVLPNASDMVRYIIYRDNTADNGLDMNEIPVSLFSDTYIFHVGTLLSATKETERTVLEALQLAKEGGAKISLDVNLRVGCWNSSDEMIRATRVLIEQADIIKATKTELEVLGLNLEQYVPHGKVFLVTDGSKEAYAYWKHHVISQAVPQVTVVDVTGAGDAFMSAFLFKYIEYMKAGEELDEVRLSKCLAVGVKAGSHAVQTYGAHESYPAKEELLK